MNFNPFFDSPVAQLVEHVAVNRRSFRGKPRLKQQANSGKPDAERRGDPERSPVEDSGNVQRLYTCYRNVKSTVKRESTSVSNSGSSVTNGSEVRALAGEFI